MPLVETGDRADYAARDTVQAISEPDLLIERGHSLSVARLLSLSKLTVKLNELSRKLSVTSLVELLHLRGEKLERTLKGRKLELRLI